MYLMLVNILSGKSYLITADNSEQLKFRTRYNLPKFSSNGVSEDEKYAFAIIVIKAQDA